MASAVVATAASSDTSPVRPSAAKSPVPAPAGVLQQTPVVFDEVLAHGVGAGAHDDRMERRLLAGTRAAGRVQFREGGFVQEFDRGAERPDPGRHFIADPHHVADADAVQIRDRNRPNRHAGGAP